MNRIAWKSILRLTLVSSFLISGCYYWVGVYVEAGSPSQAVSRSDVVAIKEVSDQVAKELNLVAATDAEVKAYDARMHSLGRVDEQTVARYDFPGDQHQLAILVTKYAPSRYDVGMVGVAPGTLGRFAPRMLRRMAEALNARLGPGRAKFRLTSAVGF
jgi:hypothetical protein